MRQKPLRLLVAGMLTVVLGVTGTVQPAQAAPSSLKPTATDPYTTLIEVGAGLLKSVLSGGGVSEADLARAVAQITAQIDQAKTEIINHIDAIGSAEVQACVRTNTIEFASINSMPRTVLQLWAQSATACASKATAYLNALVSPAAVDHVGWLVGEIYTIVIAARTKANLTEGLDLVRQDEISAFTSVRTKLTPPETTSFGPVPRCVTWWQYADPNGFIDELYYSCYAYNGDFAQRMQAFWAGTGVPAEPPIDYEGVRAEASKRTSRPVAISALVSLRNVHPGR
ncbi:hypothetical protein ACIBCH_14955 [Amycolatopsis thailandensis]|uniref:hypothetical protein n=1 Tax=Amycolatopsis thailandensis TaxID=589330 RepID=UPI0037B9A2A9